MTRETLVQWLFRFAALAMLMLGGMAWIWQQVIERHIVAGESVVDITFSPDGSHVAAATFADESISVWSLDGSRGRMRFAPPTCTLHSLEFSPDSRQLLSSAFGRLRAENVTRIYPGRIDVWDLDSGRSKRTIYIDDGAVAGIGYLNPTVAAGVLRNSVGHFNLSNGQLVEKLPLPKMSYDRLRITNDGRQLVYGFPSNTSNVTVWDIAADSLVFHQNDALTQINNMDVSRDGAWVAICGKGGGRGGRLRVWSVENDEEFHCDAGIPELIDVRILSDNSGVITADMRGVCLLWKRDGNRISRSKQFNIDGVPSRMALSSDNRLAAVVTSESISVWDVATGIRKNVLVEPPKLYSLRQIPRIGKWVLVGLSLTLFLWSFRHQIRLPR